MTSPKRAGLDTPTITAYNTAGDDTTDRSSRSGSGLVVKSRLWTRVPSQVLSSCHLATAHNYEIRPQIELVLLQDGKVGYILSIHLETPEIRSPKNQLIRRSAARCQVSSLWCGVEIEGNGADSYVIIVIFPRC
ncbi:hypothetical protein AVEN_194857-1 [Araneus ventricosus]|uniref:Uncharacterized protein n=1 Tax=Araneus ventricosus TaxID=182803 RepID=A0A4Y2B3N4_ARAVE|nr:hypothetical protein AVEN_194857-1 [Araneus ventricosus]